MGIWHIPLARAIHTRNRAATAALGTVLRLPAFGSEWHLASSATCAALQFPSSITLETWDCRLEANEPAHLAPAGEVLAELFFDFLSALPNKLPRLAPGSALIHGLSSWRLLLSAPSEAEHVPWWKAEQIRPQHSLRHVLRMSIKVENVELLIV